jgi:hypothetical protein
MALVPVPNQPDEQPPPAKAGPGQAAPPTATPPTAAPRPAAPSPAADGRPVLPQSGSDETDAGWGERPEPDDDDRLRHERPPHYE